MGFILNVHAPVSIISKPWVINKVCAEILYCLISRI